LVFVAAEVEITVALVQRLLRAQHPDLADQPIRAAGQGWDNAIFRVGDELAARLPTRQLGADLVAGEIRWLPRLAAGLPLPIPFPLRVGVPSAEYPWSWTIVPWFDGPLAWEVDLDEQGSASVLGEFIAALAQPAPADAPVNPYRGVPLAARDELLRSRLVGLPARFDAAAVLDAWGTCLAVEPFDAAPVWVHGDLHPANVVVRDGTIAAIIDFGDLTAGDPAADLSAAWMFFTSPSTRSQFRASVGGPDDRTWARARGNAIAHAVACLNAPADDVRIRTIGTRTLERALAGP
jgi:aminoglycoside phosphotransferase (APT) family kinase protein